MLESTCGRSFSTYTATRKWLAYNFIKGHAKNNMINHNSKTYHASTWLTFHELRYKKLKFSLNTVNQSLSMQQHGVICHAIIAWLADSKLSRCPALSCKRELRKKHNQFWLLPSSKVQKTLGARQAPGHYLAPRLTICRLNTIKLFFISFLFLFVVVVGRGTSTHMMPCISSDIYRQTNCSIYTSERTHSCHYLWQ